jgi:hypothetical protein
MMIGGGFRQTAELKFAYVIFRNVVRTSKKTQHFSITKTFWPVVFKEIMRVFSEIHMKPTHTVREQNTVIDYEIGWYI